MAAAAAADAEAQVTVKDTVTPVWLRCRPLPPTFTTLVMTTAVEATFR